MINKETNEQHSKQVSPELRAEYLAEFSALRDEIVKRIDIRNRLLTFSLIVAGTILAFGSRKEVTVFVLLLYPILAFFLALAWMQADIQIGTIGSYIRKNIESKLPGLNWETFYHRRRKKVKKRFFSRPTEISAAGVFFITEILAVLLAFPKLIFSIIEIIFLILNLIFIIFTFKILKERKKKFW